MTYAGGLPVLYPIAFLNFLILFWIYKALLVKFYSKTISFNQDLSNASIVYFKFGVIIHLIMTLFMYTNKDVLQSASLRDYQDQALTSAINEGTSN